MDQFLVTAGLIMTLLILFMVIQLALCHNVPERLVALDTLNTLIITLMIGIGTYSRKALYIDIAIVYGIISFIGTLYITRYVREEKE